MCLTWNYDHLNTTLQDIHQLTIINNAPSLFQFMQETKNPRGYIHKNIDTQFSSYKNHI